MWYSGRGSDDGGLRLRESVRTSMEATVLIALAPEVPPLAVSLAAATARVAVLEVPAALMLRKKVRKHAQSQGLSLFIRLA